MGFVLLRSEVIARTAWCVCVIGVKQTELKKWEIDFVYSN